VFLEVAVFLAVFLANRGAQNMTADQYAQNRRRENRLCLRYSVFMSSASCKSIACPAKIVGGVAE
jgi:hypothetical protein